MIVPRNFTNCAVEFGKIFHGKKGKGALVIFEEYLCRLCEYEPILQDDTGRDDHNILSEEANGTQTATAATII